MNLPNKLTLLRIILIPVFMVVLYWGFPYANYVVCIVLMFLPIPAVLNTVCCWVITLTTLYSGVEYFVKNKDVIATA